MPDDQQQQIRASATTPTTTTSGGGGGEFRIRSAGACTIGAASANKGNNKLATFDGLAYSGAPMKPEGWFTPVIVDLAGVKVPSQHRPALRQHDPQQIVGHTTRVKADAKGIHVSGVFSGEPAHVQKVTHPASNGFQWQLSIGANPTRTERLEAGESTEVNGRTVTGPMTIARETEIGEISFVPLGADQDTSATVQATAAAAQNNSRGRQQTMWQAMLKQLIKAAKKDGSAPPTGSHYSDEEIDKMSDAECKAAFKKRMKASDDDDDDEDDDEDDKEEKKAEAARQSRIKAARKAEADELLRCDEIKARVKKHGVEACEVESHDGKKVKVSNLAAHAIEQGWTADATELVALRAARPGPGVGLPGGLGYSTSSPEITDAVIEAAVFQATNCDLFHDDFYQSATRERDRINPRMAGRIKAELSRRYPDSVQQAAHSLFKGRIGLQQMLTTIAAGNGYRGRESISMDNLGEVAAACIRADGPSTMSVQNVTANVQNKFMLMGYLFTEQAWREVCAIRPVKDFKPTKSINLFGDVELKEVPSSGELSNASFQDQAFANSVRTHGRIMTIPRTTIINDDLGAFGQIPMLLGRGAGLKLNKVFWMKFMSPGKDDGGSTDFYATTHTVTGQTGNANYQSGAGTALSSASLTSATLLFDNQVDPVGYPLGMDAEILLFPPDLETAALELMHSEYIIMGGLASTASASKQPSQNRWKGRYRPVKSRYLNKTLSDVVSGATSTVTGSTTAWWLLANPTILPVIEVAFLNGVDAPTVQTASPDFQFNILGISTRAFFDMDANSQNYRGGVKNAGA